MAAWELFPVSLRASSALLRSNPMDRRDDKACGSAATRKSSAEEDLGPCPGPPPVTGCCCCCCCCCCCGMVPGEDLKTLKHASSTNLGKRKPWIINVSEKYRKPNSKPE